MVFEDYLVDATACKSENSLRMAKEKTMKRLKADLQNGVEGKTTVRHHIRVPLSSIHKGHPVGETAGMNQNIDKRIIDKIFERVGKGVTNIAEVKRSIEEFVDKELFCGTPADKRPRLSNRRYYPTKIDLRNHVSRAIAAQKYCKDDQESLRRKVEEWQAQSPTTKFFFRPHRKQTEEDDENKPEEALPQQNFLFVHQEEWQQRLLHRYGSELVFMDATYKTTKYAIPLFFLCVRTNVGYKVVAEFMTQYEDQKSISEALAILKSWNPLWKPNYFMVDFSTIEIGAIEEQFPGVTAYICDFHRLQAWQRWTRKSKNGLNSLEQEELLGHLKRVANASTHKAYDSGVAALQKLSLYQGRSNVQNYVDNVWLSCSFRWAKCMRKRQVLNIVDTNNGVEAQNKAFK